MPDEITARNKLLLPLELMHLMSVSWLWNIIFYLHRDDHTQADIYFSLV